MPKLPYAGARYHAVRVSFMPWQLSRACTLSSQLTGLCLPQATMRQSIAWELALRNIRNAEVGSTTLARTPGAPAAAGR